MNKLNLNTIYDWPLATRILIIGLMCSLVFYFGHKLDIASLQRTLQTSKEEEKNLKQQIEGIIAKEKTTSADISLFPTYNSKLQEWKRQFVSHANLPELLNQVLKLGSDNGLHFTLFSPGTAVTEMNYLKVPIKVVVLGNYHQIATFLSQIANMQWIVTIRDFVISDEKSAATKAKIDSNIPDYALSLELLLDVYYIAETPK